MPDAIDWTLLLVQLPTDPSRHRVAVWRELRRTGAVPIGSGTWLLPSAHASSLERVGALVRRGSGSLAEIDARPKDPAAALTLRDAYAAARIDEWGELVDDCGKFEAEIDREFAKEKFTLGELEEEEQSLDRLQRWLRTLQARDVLGLDEGRVAAGRVADCERRLGEYAERVAAEVDAAGLPRSTTRLADMATAVPGGQERLSREALVFRIVLTLKGLDGVIELVGGVLLLILRPAQIQGIAALLTREELQEDPRDFIATHVLSASHSLTHHAGLSVWGAVYLLVHGLVKVVLVWAVLRDRVWAYPWMIGFLLAFIGYQAYAMVVHFTLGLLLLTLLDIVVVWLTVREYRRLRRGRDALDHADAA